jgi:hypothetical protein
MKEEDLMNKPTVLPSEPGSASNPATPFSPYQEQI